MQKIAAGLLEQTSISVIREQQALLDELAGEEWWVGVTLPMLEHARRRIRGLVEQLEKRKRANIYTAFTDELGEIEEVQMRDLPASADFERFREKARLYLRKHEDHVALQRLRRNLPLTPTDLDALDKMLQDAGLGASENLERARLQPGGLGAFIRSLIGMDRQAATEGLSGVIEGKSLSAAQHDFVELVVEHLTANGAMNIERLYEAPFTTLAPGGRERLFPEVEVESLIASIRTVDGGALPRVDAA